MSTKGGRERITKMLHEWQPESAHDILKAKIQKKNGNVTPSEIGQVMINCYHFKKTNDRDNGRLLMYVDRKNDPRYGTYTFSYNYLEEQISRDYPNFRHSQFNNVVLYIMSRVNYLNVARNKRLIRNLIPVNNGIFDFKRKNFLHFNPKYVFTNKITTNYNPKRIQSPQIDGWNVDTFLISLANGDHEIIKQFWQIILDAIDGNHCRRKLILLYSDNQGSNGKSTFQTLIQNLVGQNNYSSLKIDQFDQRFMLSDLVGRVVDIGDNLPTNLEITRSSNVNSVATGDNVQIEQKNQSPYSTHLNCTVIQSCNGLPTFSDTGGVHRRLLIIPFNKHFFGKHDDPRVKYNYLERTDVKEYVLRKALHQSYFTNMYVSKASKQALQEYECENYPLIDFKKNCFDVWNVNKIPTKFIFELYQNFLSQHYDQDTSYTLTRFTKKFKSLIRLKYIKKVAKLTKPEHETLIDINNSGGFGHNDDSNIPSIGKAINCFVHV